MAFYSCREKYDGIEIIEIDFEGVVPSEEIRARMKSVKYQWNPRQKVWWADKNEDTLWMAGKSTILILPCCTIVMGKFL